MPAPRAPGAVFLSKNQTRQMENRNNAQQEARYAPPAFQRLYTVDDVVPSSLASLVVADTDTPKWRYTKLKGIYRGASFDTIGHGYSATGVAVRSLVCAICEYELDGTFMRMREVVRSRVVSAMTRGYKFPQVVTLDPQKNYAIANHIYFSAGPATSSFDSSDEPATVVTKEDATGVSPAFDWDMSQGNVGGLAIDVSGHPVVYSIYVDGTAYLPDRTIRSWY